jgi:phosphoglycolate phosphatase
LTAVAKDASRPPLRAVLFDLDGTVLDTAPDMWGAMNVLLAEQQRPPLPYAAVRPFVSHGANGVLRTGFADVGAERFAALTQRYLEIYRAALCRETRLFAGMPEVLEALARRGIPAGIVTNKAAWLTEPLLEGLGLRGQFACVVSGDTVAERKPHPLPMRHAASLVGAAPEECIYVGDAERDVQAAHAAGMPALVALYGYLGAGEDPHTWGGDGHLASPRDLLPWLEAHADL